MNPKLTAKYVAALRAAEKILDGQLITRLNHFELYYALGTRGYTWNGREWVQPAETATGADTLIRVMGDIDTVNETTLDICAALVARGYRIVKKTEPNKNYDNDGYRQYLTVAKGRLNNA
jgi:hypothetical protein